MNLALADIWQWLEDMFMLSKLTNVHIFNPLPALGMMGPDMDIDMHWSCWQIHQTVRQHHPHRSEGSSKDCALTQSCYPP
jgi:hypothetical protein